MRNKRGELVFDLSEAKELLREDVANKIHERLTPLQLKNTRDEYAPFTLEVFKQRIYQEVRYQKYLFYLNQKRDKAKAERDACFQGPPAGDEAMQE